MVGEAGLVGEDVGFVVEDLHALGRVLHDDAARGVADDPVEQGGGELVVERRVDDGGIRQRGLDLVHGVEVGDDPQRELPGGDVGLALDGLGLVARVAGEVEAGDREAGGVGAVEVERRALLDDAHADDGVAHLAGCAER